MKRGSRPRTSWVKGQTGNAGGRPKKPAANEARKIIKDIREAARELTPEAMATLKTVMKDPGAPPAARVSAANAILDPGCGKPKESADVTHRKTIEDWVRPGGDLVDDCLLVGGNGLPAPNSTFWASSQWNKPRD
jgi:hypothetical protein